MIFGTNGNSFKHSVAAKIAKLHFQIAISKWKSISVKFKIPRINLVTDTSKIHTRKDQIGWKIWKRKIFQTFLWSTKIPSSNTIITVCDGRSCKFRQSAYRVSIDNHQRACSSFVQKTKVEDYTAATRAILLKFEHGSGIILACPASVQKVRYPNAV